MLRLSFFQKYSITQTQIDVFCHLSAIKYRAQILQIQFNMFCLQLVRQRSSGAFLGMFDLSRHTYAAKLLLTG